MAGSINVVVLSGNLGADPEFMISQNGNSIAKLNLAVSDYDSFKKSNTTMWVKVTCFGSLAERCEKFLNKGSKVGVTGRLKMGQYTNKEGQKVNTVDIIANDITFLSSKADDTAARKSRTDTNVEGYIVEDTDLDLQEDQLP